MWQGFFFQETHPYFYQNDYWTFYKNCNHPSLEVIRMRTFFDSLSECFQVNVHSPQGLTCLCVCALVFRATSLAPFQISLLFLYYLLYNACHKLHYTKLEFELFNSYMFYKEIKRGKKLILIHLYIYSDQGHLYDLSDQGKIKMFYPGVQKVETSFYHNFSILHCHGIFISYLMVFSFWRGNIHRVNTDSYRCPASVYRAQTLNLNSLTTWSQANTEDGG